MSDPRPAYRTTPPHPLPLDTLIARLRSRVELARAAGMTDDTLEDAIDWLHGLALCHEADRRDHAVREAA